jgi:hypothetical protein
MPLDPADPLVEAATFPDRLTAELAHGALAADGIEAIIVADDVGGQYAGVWPTAVRLMVRAADLTEARQALRRNVNG